MSSIINNEKKTQEMNSYEKETGKFAIWRGIVTEGFKKWQKGEKVYDKDKERITILVPEETKNKWWNFVENQKKDFTTISKLIREAVDYYINIYLKLTPSKTLSDLSHDLKEPLTAIKGFTHLLIENYKDKLDLDVLFKIKEVYDQSLNLERIINNALGEYKTESPQYDILIIDDDASTNKVLVDFFRLKTYSAKEVSTGTEAFKILQKVKPKIILLDIILPEIDGYEICKIIKSDEKLRDIPVFYITAVPGYEVKERVEETGADGIFLKPFNFSEFEILFKYLSNNK